MIQLDRIDTALLDDDEKRELYELLRLKDIRGQAQSLVDLCAVQEANRISQCWC